jgi:hypothetical protein
MLLYFLTPYAQSLSDVLLMSTGILYFKVWQFFLLSQVTHSIMKSILWKKFNNKHEIF